jgi:hypothetical protein
MKPNRGPRPQRRTYLSRRTSMLSSSARPPTSRQWVKHTATNNCTVRRLCILHKTLAVLGCAHICCRPAFGVGQKRDVEEAS